MLIILLINTVYFPSRNIKLCDDIAQNSNKKENITKTPSPSQINLDHYYRDSRQFLQ